VAKGSKLHAFLRDFSQAPGRSGNFLTIDLNLELVRRH